MGRENKISKAESRGPVSPIAPLAIAMPIACDAPSNSSGFIVVDLDNDGHIVAQSAVLPHASTSHTARTSIYDLIAPTEARALRRALGAGFGTIALHLGHDAGARALDGFVLRNPSGGARLVLRDDSADRKRLIEADKAEEIVRFGQWTLDLSSGRIEATKGFVRLLAPENPPGAIDSAWILRHCDVKERQRIKRQILKGAKRGGPFSFQTRIVRADGQWRIVESQISVERDPTGKVSALCGVSRDVTEVVIIEKELRRLDAQHRLLINHSNDVICQLDYQGAFLFVSPAIEQITGFLIEEIVGRNISEFVHADDIEHLRNTARQANFDPAARTDQYRMLHKGGHYVWVESRVRPLMDQKGLRRLGLIAVIRDISERKHAEEALVAAHERADIANRAKTKFLANMSHELRTPLNAIIGFSEILSREMFGPLGSSRYGEYVTLILESGRHLLDLINDLLDTAKIEAGRYELTREPLDIEEIISAALRLVQRQAEKKGLILESRLAETAEPLVADQRAVKQIIINLLSNAIKFTPAGGTVRVSVGEQDTFVLITVTDTGIGIPENEVGRLARPFEQVHRDLHIAQEGTGLGLALVNSLARLHGGDIEIKSREGEGTSVIVRLPRDAAETDAAGSHAERA